MQNRFLTIAACAVLSLTLAGCSGVQEQLGFGRNSPDEFTVVKRAPLSLPPNYNLRPPEPGAPNLSQENATRAAKTSVFGTETQSETDRSDGEYGLLQQLGTDQANPEIREILETDSGFVQVHDKSVAEKLIFWNEADTSNDAVIVDAPAEAERIKGNKESGKAVNEGDVPTIEKKQSTFDKLF